MIYSDKCWKNEDWRSIILKHNYYLFLKNIVTQRPFKNIYINNIFSRFLNSCLKCKKKIKIIAEFLQSRLDKKTYSTFLCFNQFKSVFSEAKHLYVCFEIGTIFNWFLSSCYFLILYVALFWFFIIIKRGPACVPFAFAVNH